MSVSHVGLINTDFFDVRKVFWIALNSMVWNPVIVYFKQISFEVGGMIGAYVFILTIYNGLISWLARKYGLYIYFGVNLNEVRERLLHCTQRWLCTAASRGEVDHWRIPYRTSRFWCSKVGIMPRTRGQLWGTLVVLPASKEAESPSTHIPLLKKTTK